MWCSKKADGGIILGRPDDENSGGGGSGIKWEDVNGSCLNLAGQEVECGDGNGKCYTYITEEWSPTLEGIPKRVEIDCEEPTGDGLCYNNYGSLKDCTLRFGSCPYSSDTVGLFNGFTDVEKFNFLEPSRHGTAISSGDYERLLNKYNNNVNSAFVQTVDCNYYNEWGLKCYPLKDKNKVFNQKKEIPCDTYGTKYDHKSFRRGFDSFGDGTLFFDGIVPFKFVGYSHKYDWNRKVATGSTDPEEIQMEQQHLYLNTFGEHSLDLINNVNNTTSSHKVLGPGFIARDLYDPDHRVPLDDKRDNRLKWSVLGEEELYIDTNEAIEHCYDSDFYKIDCDTGEFLIPPDDGIPYLTPFNVPVEPNPNDCICQLKGLLESIHSAIWQLYEAMFDNTNSITNSLSNIVGAINSVPWQIFGAWMDSFMPQLDNLQVLIGDIKEILKEFKFELIGEEGEKTNFWDFLGGLFGDIFEFIEFLIEKIIYLVVPEDSSQVLTGFEMLSNALNSKVAPVEELKTSFTSVLNVQEKEFADVNVVLPIYGRVEFFDATYIMAAVPYARNLISGMMIIVTGFWAYRKISSGVIK